MSGGSRLSRGCLARLVDWHSYGARDSLPRAAIRSSSAAILDHSERWRLGVDNRRAMHEIVTLRQGAPKAPPSGASNRPLSVGDSQGPANRHSGRGHVEPRQRLRAPHPVGAAAVVRRSHIVCNLGVDIISAPARPTHRLSVVRMSTSAIPSARPAPRAYVSLTLPRARGMLRMGRGVFGLMYVALV